MKCGIFTINAFKWGTNIIHQRTGVFECSDAILGSPAADADRLECHGWEQFSMIPSAGIPVHNQSWWNDVLNTVKGAADLAPILINAL